MIIEQSAFLKTCASVVLNTDDDNFFLNDKLYMKCFSSPEYGKHGTGRSCPHPFPSLHH